MFSILKGQRGMSIVTVLGAIGLGLAGVTYLIKDGLPKLQGEKKKIDSQLNYRVFISSLNDYIVHGIRERWCINYDEGQSDLLLSNKCSSSSPMEDIVTYPGNLERILWGADTIGTNITSAPSAANSNKILALNFQRFHSSPQKTNVLLTYDQIVPTDGKLKFKITGQILEDMNESHPLYIMSRRIKDCINSIDVEVFQVKDFNNLASGDEKKIGIKISSDIKTTRLSCLTVKTAESMSYYTFYPRRLHTFSLVKYGNLDGSYYNEFNGPVYVAGNFILPDAKVNKEQTTIFYNSLTLGVYNGGNVSKSLVPGVVVNNGNAYSFREWGHPYKSKQDSYNGFRGFLGGVKLDSSEDKGFYNLFDHTTKTAANVAQLEACIDDNEAQLKKSKNADSELVYQKESQSSEETTIKLSFTKKNRFSIEDSPAYVLAKGSNNSPFFEIETNKSSKTLGSIQFAFTSKTKNGFYETKSNENYAATIGDNSSVSLNLNFKKFDLDKDNLSQFIEKIDKTTKANYKNNITSDVLKRANLYTEYEDATKALIQKCDNKVAADCEVLGYKAPSCTPSKPVQKGDPKETVTTEPTTSECGPSYSVELAKFEKAKTDLSQYLNQLKTFQNNPEDVSLNVSINQVPLHKGKMVLNQRYLKIKTPQGWQEYFKLINANVDTLRLRMNPSHNGIKDALTLNLDFSESNTGNDSKIVTTSFINQFTNTSLQYLKNSWSNTRTNSPVPTPPVIVKLDCPQGMGIADWDLDMSPSSNFAWNYANTPAGAFIDTNDHEQAAPIIFYPGNPPLEGHANSSTKSVVQECIIPSDRTHVYGFYVCTKLTIRERSTPLYMIGTFIVKDLSIPKGMSTPIHWYSIWDTRATDLIMSDLNSHKSNCKGVKDLVSKTWKDVVVSPQIAATVESCGPLDLVTNGPNNFSWTTVDPDIGIAKAGDIMTSQKVNRIQKWVIREESRKDFIR